jgi:hypothetical protein
MMWAHSRLLFHAKYRLSASLTRHFPACRPALSPSNSVTDSPKSRTRHILSCLVDMETGGEQGLSKSASSWRSTCMRVAGGLCATCNSQTPPSHMSNRDMKTLVICLSKGRDDFSFSSKYQSRIREQEFLTPFQLFGNI